MTFGELKTTVGSEIESRLVALNVPNVGLYYDEVPNPYERLYVRFWFPFTGLYKSSYGDDAQIDRLLLQIDVRHFPPPGSAATPPGDLSEQVWEALKLRYLPGVAGCTRQPDSRVPLKDMGDHSRWGWHRYALLVAN